MKLSDKARDIISAIAPTLGMALGGPLGGLAGNVLASVVGGDESKIEAQILSHQPDVMLKLKQADQDFQIKMRELDISDDALYAKDRDSARQREAAVKDKMPAILGGVVVGGFFIVVYTVLYGEARVDSVLAGTIIGYVSAKADQVLSYFFGSTKGSEAKNAVIKTLSEK